jgi:FKBP-type peptidyl-prolyl cis-trans isomerase
MKGILNHFLSLRYFSLTVCLFALSACQKPKTEETSTVNAVIETASGLKYSILNKGTGPAAAAGDEVLIYETTRYRDGTVIYSNENTNSPVKVLIGGNQATEGMDEGLRGMQAGETRKLILPTHLSKRSGYPPNLSPDSIIVITVRIDKILPKP